MNGIVINIDPVIFQIAHFQIRWYSLIIMTAVAVGLLIAARALKQRGLSPEVIYSLAPWLLVGGIIGARAFHIIDQWGYYAQNPGQILQLQLGGLAIYGAIAGGAIALIVYARRKRISIPYFFDIMVPGLLVAQMIGRIGCIIDGDAAGAVTNLPWAFIYAHPNAMIPSALAGLPTHPYPVYEIIWDGLSLLLLLKLRPRFAKDGLLSLSYLTLYSLGRFALTFVREEKIVMFGLQQAQVIALVILV